MKKITTALVLLLLASSCASKKPKEDTGMVFAEKVFDIWKEFTNKELKKTDDDIVITRTALPRSFNVAVYFMDNKDKNQNWSWSREEKDLITTTLEKNDKAGNVFELINTTNKDPDLKALRYMAAQQGADALMLVRGVAGTESQMNLKALSYLALLPMLFVEGNNIEGNFLAQAVLWDVRKPFVHLGLEAEGDWEMERPLAFKQRNRAVEKAKHEAISSLGNRLSNQLTRIKI